VTELRPGDSIGGYRIEELLGEGAVGIVFRAVREVDGTTVALKVLRERLSRDETYRRRLLREARVARDLQHRNVVPVLDAGEEGGRFFLIARFVPGASLRELISQGPVPLGDLVRLASDLASGLDALHGAGLVHRDVKPSNVLFDQTGSALLTDFGLAKASAYTILTEPGRIVGTLDYLAPELFRGEPASRLSDIYSFGCLVFEALAGRAPFAGRSLLEIGVAHLDEEPEDPGITRDGVPPDFSWAVLRALAKDPADRPPTATVYATMLRVAARPGA
jgi:serine/threonine protein kinase